MNNFKKINMILGWATFVISAFVYTLTMEPSASLWDCSEFIATSYKLEVGHPPGAPLFMIINRLFSMFASDVTTVALMVNMASVVASALTIMFLYWTIAHLALKLAGKSRETAQPKDSLLIYGSAFVGAMAYAFTDTFWFSAVEGEVYAQSSLFTAMVFWAMFKWENESDKYYSSRWLILIAYLMGLSIGVHLLNLLTIPALVMIYYYKTCKNRSRFGWWKIFGLSVVILAAVLFVVIPKTVALGAWFDKLFVNSFGFEKNIGFFAFVILLMSAIAALIYYTNKRKKVVLNTIFLCLGVLLVGYGTYASVIIRSSANPPMNSNQPDDAYSLMSFLNREQYGNTPRLYGQYYSSPLQGYENKKSFYYDEDEKTYKHTIVADESTLQYPAGSTTIFPRMYSSSHANSYKTWVDITGKTVSTPNGAITVPTFAENLEFFFKYQVNYMYWRYFLWNFVGRQNDIQGDGSFMKGNWLSGIGFIDELYVGTQENLPEDLLNNHARNTYFFLPFLLGVAGLVYQMSKKREDFVVVSFIFLMTGLAIILYLNQTPDQPRERDYAYAGSFYAFSIWIGLGVFWVKSAIDKILKKESLATIMAIVLSLSVPTILLAQNWDDHDRSGRYLASDIGKGYLQSTLPNSILLSYGDNDTFGPWYAQEVEGVRTDVRICNLSYMQSNWYALQMRYKFNESNPIEFTIPTRVYGLPKHDYIPIVELSNNHVPIMDVMKFIDTNTEAKKNLIKSIGYVDAVEEIFPARKIAIPVNKKNALKAGIIKESDLDNVVDTIFIELNKNKNSLGRHEYLFLDMLATSDWSRPIYVTQSSVLSDFGLTEYLQYDGLAYKIVPIKNSNAFLRTGKIDTEYLYNKVMNEYKYGNISDPNVMLDVFSNNTIRSTQLRNIFGRLAIELVNEGQKERGSEVILRCLEEVPLSQIGHDYFSPTLIEALHLTGNGEKAEELLDDAIDYYMSYMMYFSGFDKSGRFDIASELSYYLSNMAMLHNVAKKYGYTKQSEILRPYTEVF